MLKFKPQFFLQNTHLQTILPWLLRKNLKIKYQQERLELPDGDFLDLFFTKNYTAKKVILVLSGLEGCHNSHYMKGLSLFFMNNPDYSLIAMNHRGCGYQTNRLLTSYHAGKTEDLNFVVNYLIKEKKITQIALVGFSMGGNILLKWLGETANWNKIKAAVAISTPFKLYDTALWLKKTGSKIYKTYLLNKLKQALTKKAQFQKIPAIDKLAKIKELIDFDATYTAPLNKFKSVEDYYLKSSCYPFLKKITTPTLLIQAKDDPIVPSFSIPILADLSDSITLEASNYGGHSGFIYWQQNIQYWLENRIFSFIKQFDN